MSKPNLKSAKIVAIMLVVALVASLITYQLTQMIKPSISILDVDIFPSDIDIPYNTTKTFLALIHNGTAPYNVAWYSNETYLGNGAAIDFGCTSEFGFSEPFSYASLKVIVTDANNGIGMDSTLVYDSFQGAQESLPFYIGAPQPYSYVIDTNGTHYFAFNGTDGFLEQTNTNASTVERFADGNLTNGGTIYVKQATYNLDAGWTLGKRTYLVFEANTRLNMTGNANVITIDTGTGLDNDACYAIIGPLNISMNQVNGNGIYAVHGASSANRQNSRIQDIFIHDVAVGYSGINITDPYHTIVENIKIRTYGTGIYLGSNNSKATWFGDGFELRQVNIGFLGDNVIGIDVAGGYNLTGTDYGFNYMSWNDITLIDSTLGTGTIGLHARGLRHSVITGFVAEKLAVAVDLGDELNGVNDVYCDTYAIDFVAPKIQDIGTDGFWVRNGAYGINIFGGKIDVDSGGLCYNNTNTQGYSSKVIGTRFTVDGSSVSDGSCIVGTGNVDFRDCSGYVTEVWITNSTASNGGIQAVNLAGTADYVFVTSGNSTEQIICGAYDLASDHFHYYLHDDAGNAVTGQTVYVYAVFNP